MWSVAGRSKSLLSSTLQRAVFVRSSLPAATSTDLAVSGDISVRSFSSGKHKSYSPRRRPGARYRPTKPRGSPYFRPRKVRADSFEDRHAIELGGKAIPTQLGSEEEPATGSEDDRYDHDGLSRKFGPHMARAMRSLNREQDVRKGQRETVEDYLRDMDYLTSPEGSTEELAYERRAMSMECDTEEERENFLKDIDQLVAEHHVKDLELEQFQEDLPVDDEGIEHVENDINDPLAGINPNQKAFGEWYVLFRC